MRILKGVCTALVACSASVAVAAFAPAIPCTLIGDPSLSPAHPGPADAISFQLSLIGVPMGATDKVVATSFVDSASNSIYLDAVITADVRPFPGRRVVNDPLLDAFGSLVRPSARSLSSSSCA